MSAVSNSRCMATRTAAAGAAFFAQAAPAFEAYAAGDAERAIGLFLSLVSGMDGDRCRALLEERVPGSVEQTVKDADTFFGVELPALAEWGIDPGNAGAIRQPVLSVLGSDTRRCGSRSPRSSARPCPTSKSVSSTVWVTCSTSERPRPVAGALAGFLDRHPITSPSNT